MKTAIQTEHAPKAIGPYSQAVRAGGFLWVSGQLGIDPVTGALEADFVSQAKRVFGNLHAILAAAGSSTNDVVKVSVFVQDMNDFAALNEIYATQFREPYPARETVQVARLPKDAKVEISIVALAR